MCEKNTTYNGYHNGIWSPLNKEWNMCVEFPMGKMNTPPRKIVILLLSSTFVDMFWLHAYHQIQRHCAYPNYDNAIPNILEIGKRSPSLMLGRVVKIFSLVCMKNSTMVMVPQFTVANILSVIVWYNKSWFSNLKDQWVWLNSYGMKSKHRVILNHTVGDNFWVFHNLATSNKIVKCETNKGLGFGPI